MFSYKQTIKRTETILASYYWLLVGVRCEIYWLLELFIGRWTKWSADGFTTPGTLFGTLETPKGFINKKFGWGDTNGYGDELRVDETFG